MAWNFSGGGRVECRPLTSWGTVGFFGMTVDFKVGTGDCRFATFYTTGDPTHVSPMYIDLSGTTLLLACENAPRRTWPFAVRDGQWHHLNLYTNSEARDGIAILDGAVLAPTVISNPSHLHSNGGLLWVIGGDFFGGGFDGLMAHLNIGITMSDLFWNGNDRWRESVRVGRANPTYFRNYAAAGAEDPDGTFYVSMEKEPTLSWDDLSGQPLTINGTVTWEETPADWWVIGRMEPYIDVETEFVPPPTPTRRVRRPCPQECL